MPGRYQFLPPAARSSWFRVGTFDVNTSALIAGLSAVSMVVYALDKSLLNHLSLNFLDVRSGQLWRLITWPLVNAPDFWVAIAIYFFWTFGSQLEDFIGKQRFLWFLVVLTIIPAIAVTLVSYLVTQTTINGVLFYLPVNGIRFLELGVFAAFAIEFPGVRFFFGLKSSIMAALLIGLDALRFTGDRLYGYLLMLALSIVVATLELRAFGLGAGLPSWVPKIPLPKFITGNTSKRPKGPIAKARAQSRRQKSALRVVENDSTLTPMDDIAPHVAAERRRRVDAILDKISSQGMESLTAEEREILQRGGKG